VITAPSRDRHTLAYLVEVSMDSSMFFLTGQGVPLRLRSGQTPGLHPSALPLHHHPLPSFSRRATLAQPALHQRHQPLVAFTLGLQTQEALVFALVVQDYP